MAGTLNKATNIDKLGGGVNDLFALAHLRQSVEAVIGDFDDSTFGSVVANAYGAARAPPPAKALKSDDFPALGKPTNPNRSIGRRGYRRLG